VVTDRKIYKLHFFLKTMNKQNYVPENHRELTKMANELLAQAGFDKQGRCLGVLSFHQRKWEARAQTGAYCGQNKRK
jgi:hypothetical protein